MDLRQLTPDLAVSPQIDPEDVAALASAGYRVLINNRPDAEVGPELDHHRFAELAKEAGMTYFYIAFQPGQISADMVEDFAKALEAPGPKLAYCRSGNRSTVLWALTQAGNRSADELSEIAAKAGYDLSSIRPLLQAFSG